MIIKITMWKIIRLTVFAGQTSQCVFSRRHYFEKKHKEYTEKKERYQIIQESEQYGVAAEIYLNATLALLKQEMDEIKSTAIKRLEMYPEELKISGEWTKDMDAVFAATKRKPEMFQYAAPELKRNRKFILRMTDWNPSIFQHAALELQEDPDFATQVVKIDTRVFKYASPKLKTDPNLILKLLKDLKPSVFRYIAEELQQSQTFISKAVEANFRIIKYIDPTKPNQNLIIKAIKSYPEAYRYTPPALQKDKQFTLKAIKANRHVIRHLNLPFKSKQDLILKAIKFDPQVYQYAPANHDKAFAMKAIQANWMVVSFMHPRFKSDKDLMLAAIKCHSDALEYLPFTLLNDPDFMIEAVRIHANAFDFFGRAMTINVELFI